MDRRHFVRGALIASAGATLAACENTAGNLGTGSGPQVQWRLASSFPSSLDTLFGASQGLAEKVSAATGGRFTIEAFQGGELVPGLEVLDAVQAGSVEIGHTSGSYYIGKDPVLAFDAAIPFGLNARQHNSWLYSGNGLTLMREALAKFNIISFPGGNTGGQMGGWFRRPIDSLADLRGLRMRIPGLGGEVMQEMGVNVQLIAAGEVFQALDRGALDATEFVGPHDDLKLGFNEVAPYYYYPGWWEPGSAVSFYVNQSSWESLPPEYQTALTLACDSVNVEMLSEYDHKNAIALKTIKDSGTEVREFGDDIVQRAFSLTQEKLIANAQASPEYRKVFDDWAAFKASTSAWLSTTDLSMDEAATSLQFNTAS